MFQELKVDCGFIYKNRVSIIILIIKIVYIVGQTFIINHYGSETLKIYYIISVVTYYNITH